MQRPAWWPPRRPKHPCVVGLDLSPAGAWVVALEGSAPRSWQCLGIHALDVPEGLVQGAHVADPMALGHWLKAWMGQQGWAPQGLCLALDEDWLTRQTVALSAHLGERDVAFQLAAELTHTHAVDPAQVSWTYQVARHPHAQAHPAQVSYVLAYLATDPLTRWQDVANAAGVRAWVIEPRTDAVLRAQRASATDRTVSSCPAHAQAAFGLALAAWAEAGLNFLPHRRWARQRRQRAWGRHLAWVTAGSATLTLGLTAVMDHEMPMPVVSPEALEAVSQRWTVARQTHSRLAEQQQQAHAQGQWQQAQQRQQVDTVQWLTALRQAPAQLWVSQVRQHDAHWAVHGEALGATDVDQWLAQLTALPVWQKPPEVHQLQFTRSVAGTGAWVWQFRIEAQLKGGR